jgi:hypothetical protein
VTAKGGSLPQPSSIRWHMAIRRKLRKAVVVVVLVAAVADMAG